MRAGGLISYALILIATDVKVYYLYYKGIFGRYVDEYDDDDVRRTALGYDLIFDSNELLISVFKIESF